VFKVSNSVLNSLDRLEGHPNWYRRRQVDIKMRDKTLSCWIYFNIKQDGKGHTWHKTYEQVARRVSEFNWDDYTPDDTDDSPFAESRVSLIDIDEFDIESEKPICVDCFHDLEHDGFANYHCSGCNGWFAEDEVLRFRP